MLRKNKKLILFYHIEKAGGSSLKQVFSQNMPCIGSQHARRSWGGVEYEEFDREQFLFVMKRLPVLSGFSGHYLRPWYDYSYNGQNPLQVTFLREPTARYVSQFHYSKKALNFERDWDGFIQLEQHHNLICKRFSRENCVEEAIEVLSKFEMVGVLEHLQKSLKLMAERLQVGHWDLNCPFRNQGNQKDYDSKLLEEARELNRNDCLIYKHFEGELQKVVHPVGGMSVAYSEKSNFQRALRLKLANLFREYLYIPIERKAFFLAKSVKDSSLQ